MALAVLAMLLPGCAGIGCCFTATTESGDSVRYVVLGLGVVSVPKPAGAGIAASRVQAVGFTVSSFPDLRFTAGYLGAAQVAIGADSQDVFVDVGYCATGLAIDKKNARSHPSSHEQERKNP